jgi:AraC family transcriptional regulator
MPGLATLLQLLVPSEFVVHSTNQWRWLRSFATARWMLRIAARCADDAVDSDALAECLGTLDGTSTEQPERAPQWLQRVRQRVADECTARVRVSDLARDAGVHPVHLTREFRRYYGTSVVGCVQLHRVRRAADALAGSSAPISHIALSAGFADQSHLTRVFKRGLGVTPGAFRTGAARGSV